LDFLLDGGSLGPTLGSKTCSRACFTSFNLNT
jgi:hypothetical protein